MPSRLNDRLLRDNLSASRALDTGCQPIRGAGGRDRRDFNLIMSERRNLLGLAEQFSADLALAACRMTVLGAGRLNRRNFDRNMSLRRDNSLLDNRDSAS